MMIKRLMAIAAIAFLTFCFTLPSVAFASPQRLTMTEISPMFMALASRAERQQGVGYD